MANLKLFPLGGSYRVSSFKIDGTEQVINGDWVKP